MNTTIEQATQQIEAAQAALQLAKFIPDLSQLGFPVEEGYFGSSKDGIVCIHLPYNVECYRRFRRLLGKGWKADHWWFTQHQTDNNMVRNISIYRNGFTGAHIMVKLDPRLDKSICQVKQVGVKEVPVMQIICS
jgi:hypothetical protein